MSNINALLWSTAVGLTMFAGSLLSLFKRKNRSQANLKAFIAGVIIHTAHMEIIPHAQGYFKGSYGYIPFMLIGVLIASLLHEYAPHFHEDDIDCSPYRAGVISFVAISIHNIIEGASLFTIASENSVSGIAYGLGVIAHNLPIGLMLTASLMMSSKNKVNNLIIAFFASLMTALGAVIKLQINHLSQPFAIGVMLSLSAGMMIYSALDTLAQSAKERSSHRILYWFLGGMLFIGLVLVFSEYVY